MHGILRSMDGRLCWVVRCWRGRRKSAYVQAVNGGWVLNGNGEKLDAISFFEACWLVAIFCSLKKIPNIENPTKIEVSFPAQKTPPHYIYTFWFTSTYLTIDPSSLKQLLPLLIFKMKCYIEGSIYSLVCLLPFFMECRRYFHNFQGISQVFQG